MSNEGASARRPTFVVINRAEVSEPYADGRREAILSLSALDVAHREISAWPNYAPTPLVRLPGIARQTQVGAIYYKDEGGRFGLGSFKALGGAYAVMRLLQDHIAAHTGVSPSAAAIAAGEHGALCAALTVTCATDGNHGRSVAWGAHTFGCRCVIYVHETVSQGRADAIASYGAEVRRITGNYDDAVRQASADAAAEAWHVVSDTSYEGYVDVPRDVMQGYGVMVQEALMQLPPGVLPTHVFVQGGVGGLAAAVCATLWERLGAARPFFTVVEPDRAACLFRSGIAGTPVVVEGALDTIMAGLACGEVSVLAWNILGAGTNAFMTIEDRCAIETMRLLADSAFGDRPIVAGESAVAGLGGLLQAADNAEARAAFGIDNASVVLLFGTEGATDPGLYEELVGRTAEAVVAA